MLGIVLRLLTLLRMASTFTAAKERFAEQVSDALARAMLLGIALVVGTLAVLFFTVAAFLALATVWPAHWAAFAIGIVLLGVAAVIMLTSKLQRRKPAKRRPRPAAAVRDDQGTDEGADLDELLQSCQAWVKRNPGLVLGAALGFGILFGLSRGRSSKSD